MVSQLLLPLHSHYDAKCDGRLSCHTVQEMHQILNLE